MPELPEVETVRRSLRPLIGKRITRARLIRADMCTKVGTGNAAAADVLEGATVVELARRGKRLAIVSQDGRALIVHLGMTGHLRLAAPGQVIDADRHIHADWTIEDGSTMYFRDPRRFGGLWTFPDRERLREHLNELGPDALHIRYEELMAALSGSRRAIKAALLNQTAVAGIGNIYADESLFRARIRPTRRANRLSRDEWKQLAAAVRKTLADAIRVGGSTLRDYADASGTPGQAQHKHSVYGRAGEPCVRCGAKLRGIRLAQRATVFCPRCQR